MYVPGIAIMKNLPEQRELPVANDNLAKCETKFNDLYYKLPSS